MNYGAPVWISFIDPDSASGEDAFYVNARLIATWSRNRSVDSRGKITLSHETTITLFTGGILTTSESFEAVTRKMLDLDLQSQIGKLE